MGQSSYRFAYRELAEALCAALANDPFYITLERHSTGSEGLLKYLDYSMLEAREYGELLVPQRHQYGVSLWLKPLDADRAAMMKAAKRQFLIEHLGESAEQVYQKMVDSMAVRSAQVVDDVYWYLSIVGILPEHQGQGLGPDLINPVLARTDDLGVPTYLETFTPRNHRFYQRLGYRVAAGFDEPITGAAYSVMTRSPVS